MDTPICDFVQQYAQSHAIRMHMPGHKGSHILGLEHLDITEIDGADSLYEANGIIGRSEQNASSLFGCPTYYSTEGSSQCIRAMLYLAMLYGKEKGRAPLIAAARNVHKTFLSACALLDLDVLWLYPEHNHSYLSCEIKPDMLERALYSAPQNPAAVYLTSPDYLGNCADISAIAAICHKHDILLLIDNAHGAYLRFLIPSLHPIDLGADLCCDSAHKTLPVLTGGAYLHISPRVEKKLAAHAKNALAMFGSTSPSYLILQSLDAANAYLNNNLGEFVYTTETVKELKLALINAGYMLTGQEPAKITVCPKSYGYTGTELANILMQSNIICEFSDEDHLVLMVSTETDFRDLQHLQTALLNIPQKEPIGETPPIPHPGKTVLTIREAMLSVSETIPIEKSIGRILAYPSVGCPPAVPILVCGEQIDSHSVKCFQYYGIRTVTVVKEINRL